MGSGIKYARSGEVHIAYRVFGDGPRDLVLIPGTLSHAVHTGARIAAAARPQEILVSGTVRDLVAGSGIRFDDRGSHALKGVPGDWRLFAVTST